MSFFQALLLGIVQGLTEFLPISSSGHLILVPSLMGWSVQSLAFDTVLHLGTLTALVIYFYKDLLEIIKNKSLIVLLLVGSVPAAIIGFFLDAYIENTFRSVNSVIIFMSLGTVLMFCADYYYSKVWHKERLDDFHKVTNSKSFLVGMFQSLALFSGVSRSGATISGGMLLGLTRELAARFSFILSIPIVAGAAMFKILDSYQELSFHAPLLAGFLGSFMVGILAINFLIKYLKTNNLRVFIIYRVLLIISLIILF